jgi:hypothetical protein
MRIENTFSNYRKFRQWLGLRVARSADGSDSGKAVLGKAWARLGQAAEKAVNN